MFTFLMHLSLFVFFFFNDTATTEIYTLSLHDALPIAAPARPWPASPYPARARGHCDRKSTRLNSSHVSRSYAVFCLKKKNKINQQIQLKKKKKNNINKNKQIIYL